MEAYICTIEKLNGGYKNPLSLRMTEEFMKSKLSDEELREKREKAMRELSDNAFRTAYEIVTQMEEELKRKMSFRLFEKAQKLIHGVAIGDFISGSVLCMTVIKNISL